MYLLVLPGDCQSLLHFTLRDNKNYTEDSTHYNQHKKRYNTHHHAAARSTPHVLRTGAEDGQTANDVMMMMKKDWRLMNECEEVE